FGVIDDGGQNVVEFVSDAGGQGADAAHALSLHQLLAKVLGLRQRSHHVFMDHEALPPGPAESGKGRGGTGSTPSDPVAMARHVRKNAEPIRNLLATGLLEKVSV